MPVKCVIIDDEQYAIDQLQSFIAQMPNLQLKESFVNPVTALTSIKAEDELDFIFLDIEMPDINGLELAKTLRAKTKHLVFTTGHSGHAIAAFDLKASHYLLKPISFNKFALAITELLGDETAKVKELPNLGYNLLKPIRKTYIIISIHPPLHISLLPKTMSLFLLKMKSSNL